MIKFLLNNLLTSVRNIFGFAFIKEQLLDIKVLAAQTLINQIKIMPAAKKLGDWKNKLYKQNI
tara:strand:+ start:254 stop:442 length:189 start_codon:yes stop_codon:yes gene_type:complete